MSEERAPGLTPPIDALQRHRHFNRVFATWTGFGRFAAVNHSIVGKRFMVTAFFFFLVGGILAMLIRAQLATSDSAFMSHEAYNQVFTMHGTVMMFLFAIPMIEGFALYMLPKILGARDLAYPRLSAFGYWCYLFGGTIILGGMVLGLAPDGGWFLYTPLSGREFTPGINADIWLLGITFVEISAVAAAVEIVVTIMKVRAAGMKLAKMPLIGWYILVTALMMIVGFPPLILASILLELERAFDLPFFEVARGGDPVLWQHLFWMFGHPEVYIIFLPAAGVVSTLIPVFAGRPLVGYTWIVVSIIATGFISFGLWVHHMFTVGIPHLAQAFFSAASMLVAVPTAVQFFAWIATLYQGRPRYDLPMLYLFGFLVIFVMGGLTGVMLALVPFNWQVHDTHFVVAHLHYVLFGGFLFPFFAACYYWYPQMTGRMPSRTLGTLAFWLIFIGFNLTFLIMHMTGLMGMPRRVYVYESGLGWDWPNLVSTIGGFIMTAGIALFVLDMALHRRLGAIAPQNPWGASTLEWAMPTPPQLYNFASLPRVDDRDPLWRDGKLGAKLAAGDGLLPLSSTGRQESITVDPLTGEPDHVIILPNPGYEPFFAASGMAVFFLAFLAGFYWLSPLGLLIALYFILRWAWTTGTRTDVTPITPREGEKPLQIQAHARHGPGWWGTAFTLGADGTFFASLLFGYLYLWTIAPNWPPPALIAGGVVVPAVMALLIVIPALAARWSIRAMSRNDSPSPALVLAGLAGAAGAIGIFSGIWLLTPDPFAHAYGATTIVLAGYIAFHALVSAIMAGYALARRHYGYVAARRMAELRILSLWADYTAVTGLIGLAAIFILPGAIG